MTVTRPVTADLTAWLKLAAAPSAPALVVYGECMAAALSDIESRVNIPTAGRTVADGVTNSTTTITSATAAFVASDVGVRVTGSAFLPTDVTIASVTNGTTAVLSAAATGTGTAQSFVIAAYPQKLRTAILLTAARLAKRSTSPEGVVGFGDLGIVRFLARDPDVEALILRLLKLDGFY